MRIEFPVTPDSLTVVTEETSHEVFHQIRQYSIDSNKLQPRKPAPYRKSNPKKEDVKLVPRKKSVQKGDK